MTLKKIEGKKIEVREKARGKKRMALNRMSGGRKWTKKEMGRVDIDKRMGEIM